MASDPSLFSGYRLGGQLPPEVWQQLASMYSNPANLQALRERNGGGSEYVDYGTGLTFAPKFKEIEGNQIFDGGTVYNSQNPDQGLGHGAYSTAGSVYDANGRFAQPFQINKTPTDFMDRFGFLIPLLAPFAASAMGAGAAGAGAAEAGGGAAAAGGSAAGGTAASGAAGAAEMGANGAFLGEGVASGVPAWDAAAGGSLSSAAGFTPTAWTTGGAPVWGVVDPAVTGATLPATSMGGALEFGAGAAGGAAGASAGGSAGGVPPNPYAWQTYTDPKVLANLANSPTGSALLKAGTLAASTLGSGSTAADFAAQQGEVEARKKAARDQLNFFFGMGDNNPNAGERQQLYQKVRDDAFTAGRRQLDEQKADAARKTKFELFARGLAGGSEDIDQNARLDRNYTQGLMGLGSRADAARDSFRNEDENTRLSLLQSIDAGMDQGTALSTAAERMKLASDRAASDANGAAVGDLLDTSGLIYNQGQMARGRADAQALGFSMFPQNKGTRSARTSATGTLTRLPGE